MPLPHENMPTEVSTAFTVANSKVQEIGGIKMLLPDSVSHKLTLRFSDDCRIIPPNGMNPVEFVEFHDASGLENFHTTKLAFDFAYGAIKKYNLWAAARDIEVDIDDGEHMFNARVLEEPPREVVTICATNGDQDTKLDIYNFGEPLELEEIGNVEDLVRTTLNPLQKGLPSVISYLIMVDSMPGSSTFVRGVPPFMVSRGVASMAFNPEKGFISESQERIIAYLSSVLFSCADWSSVSHKEGPLDLGYSVSSYSGQWGMRLPLSVSIEPVD